MWKQVMSGHFYAIFQLSYDKNINQNGIARSLPYLG